MTKYLIAALAAVAVLLGLWGWGSHQKAARAALEVKAIATQRDGLKASLEAVNRSLLRNQELTIARIATAEAQRKAADARARKLDEALKSNPDWASRPVPPGVWDALPGGPAAAPAAANGTTGRLPSALPPK